MAAMVLLLAASCKKEENKTIVNEDGLVMKTFGTGIAQNGDAKTGLVPGTNGNRFNQKWFNTDKISVSSVGTETTTQIFSFDNFTSEDESTATFTGLVKPDAQTYYAFYPAANTDGPVKSSYDESTKVVTFTLPANQTYVENSYSTNFAPMAATGTADQDRLQFENLCGLFEFRIYTDEYFPCILNQVILQSYAPSKAVAPRIAGRYQYGFDGTKTLEYASGGLNQIVLNCNNLAVSHDESNPTSLIFVLPPVVFDYGFALTYKGTVKGEGNVTLVDNGFVDKKVTIEAGNSSFNNDPYELKPDFIVGLNQALLITETTVVSEGEKTNYYVDGSIFSSIHNTTWVEVEEYGVLIYKDGETCPDPATATIDKNRFILTGVTDVPLVEADGRFKFCIDGIVEEGDNSLHVNAYAKYKIKDSSAARYFVTNSSIPLIFFS